MLTLSRKAGQRIVIGEDITITVIRIDEDDNPRVTLGISAPDNIIIDREEVRDARIKKIDRMMGKQ